LAGSAVLPVKRVYDRPKFCRFGLHLQRPTRSRCFLGAGFLFTAVPRALATFGTSQRVHLGQPRDEHGPSFGTGPRTPTDGHPHAGNFSEHARKLEYPAAPKIVAAGQPKLPGGRRGRRTGQNCQDRWSDGDRMTITP